MKASEELFFANELLGDLILLREQIEEQLDKCYKKCVSLAETVRIAESLDEVVLR